MIIVKTIHYDVDTSNKSKKKNAAIDLYKNVIIVKAIYKKFA